MPAEPTWTIHLWTFLGGLSLGMIFALLAWFRSMAARGDLRKVRQVMSERIELEAQAMSKLRTELEALRKQTENLRVKVAELNQAPEKRIQRELEIVARAEKSMTAFSPGFPAAWDSAKRSAHEEISGEENGQSLPRRIFQKFTGLTQGKTTENIRQITE